jgi:hypothetical protein
MNQNGGSKNYSETSDFNPNYNNKNYSETSVTMNQNGGSKNYSETSDFNPNYNNKNYSEAITILYSLKSSSDIQGLHTDYDTKIEIGEKNYPLSCIFALQDNTHFRYLSKSHKLNNGGGKMLEKLITLNFGQFILFHPFLIHSGWFFKGRSNLRIHFYIDDRAIFDRIKEAKERYNETYFIDIDRKRQPSFYFATKELHKMKGLLSLKRVKKNNIKKNLSKV